MAKDGTLALERRQSCESGEGRVSHHVLKTQYFDNSLQTRDSPHVDRKRTPHRDSPRWCGVCHLYSLTNKTFLDILSSMIRSLTCAMALDGLTKTAALMLDLPHVFNTGQDHGPMGYELQLILTGASLVFFLWLAQDARLKGAQGWIGCVIGGGLANVVSILTGPQGVLDFIPVGSIMLNVADVFIWAGLMGVILHVARLALKDARTR